MSEDIVIRADNLGKKYVIGHQAAERNPTLRDAITRSARQWARSINEITKGFANVAGDETEEFWALKNVNFQIHRGDVIGVIGRNGAGKSTLLKVLSRITEPSEGRVEIRGRVASLLEVGTGFHPELSGRENIYLNGAILGMSQAEIRSKFDEIVAFAEIEKFLDTPVKRYSSGMYVRLAFAVAAHLEPEILIVDEVLAVGDAEFQKKCLGKMQDVAGHGRTVLFVSHQMPAIRALCPTTLYLKGGAVEGFGKTADLVARYLQAGDLSVSTWRASEQSSFENPYFVPTAIRVSGSRVTLEGQVRNHDPLLFVGFSLETADETVLLWTHHRDSGDILTSRMNGRTVELSFELPIEQLNSGSYKLRLAIFLHNKEYVIPPGEGPAVYFQVPDVLARTPDFEQPRPGILAPQLSWTAKAIPSEMAVSTETGIPSRARS